MEKAKSYIKDKQLGGSDADVLLAAVFFTVDSNCINPVMRELWANKKFSGFNDRQKFAIAASVLIQSYILEIPIPPSKCNLKRMNLKRTRVGRDISRVSYYPGEAEILLPVGYFGQIIELGDEGVVLDSEDVASSSEPDYRNPRAKLYQ